jgi:hypothetical protein
MNDAHDEWWLATLGRTVIWARLRVLEAGTAEVFDSDGATLPYDSEDTARAASFKYIHRKIMGCFCRKEKENTPKDLVHLACEDKVKFRRTFSCSCNYFLNFRYNHFLCRKLI